MNEITKRIKKIWVSIVDFGLPYLNNSLWKANFNYSPKAILVRAPLVVVCSVKTGHTARRCSISAKRAMRYL